MQFTTLVIPKFLVEEVWLIICGELKLIFKSEGESKIHIYREGKIAKERKSERERKREADGEEKRKIK